MKKIINGKLYDTDTAKVVGFYENARSRGDFSHMEETLYKKRTGEFFLFGEGGPMTKYAKSCGQNSWSGGEEIIPFDEVTARYVRLTVHSNVAEYSGHASAFKKGLAIGELTLYR